MTRLRYLALATAAAATIAIVSVVPMPVRLTWNASASTPIGLYELDPSRDLKVGEIVAITPPKPLAAFMVRRGYIGRGVPLLKHIAALPGQRVCRFGTRVSVDGMPVANALVSDRLGRPLPVWQGCRRIAKGELFLLNASVRDSFDGRYFGALSIRNVIGMATPIYTEERDAGPFVWWAGRSR
ncbi:MAG: conjugative transfer signal peptidase TraF [Alphaproteobacteria bacterium]|nr:conjugative transfer signal peptidase TraF [Alphaproteobacteria bacterium]